MSERPGPRRQSQARVLEHLRRAARKGDRAALALALDDMRTLAFSPRYWTRYLALMQNPLARLVDLLILKQGDRIAAQKGWTRPEGPPRPPARSARRRSTAKPPRRRTPARRRPAGDQPSLFPNL